MAAADQAAVAVPALVVDRVRQRLGDQRPLDGQVIDAALRRAVAAAGRQGLVHRPAGRDMVQDDATAARDADRIVLHAGLVARAHADVADDDVVGGDDQRLAAQGDPVAGRRLAGEGNVGPADLQRRGEGDGSADIEDDGSGAPGLDRRPQAARARIGQGRDPQDSAAATAGRVAPEPLRARKGRGAIRQVGRGAGGQDRGGDQQRLVEQGILPNAPDAGCPVRLRRESDRAVAEHVLSATVELRYLY